MYVSLFYVVRSVVMYLQTCLFGHVSMCSCVYAIASAQNQIRNQSNPKLNPGLKTKVELCRLELFRLELFVGLFSPELFNLELFVGLFRLELFVELVALLQTSRRVCV